MISVVVPAYRAASLARCVTRLLDQVIDEPVEVIVCVSADRASELPVLVDDPRLRVLTHVPRLPAAVARNRAAASSTGRMIAFTDADAMAQPDWLSQLAAACEGHLCVAGAVGNGTPKSAAGTAEYLVEFIKLHPRRPARSVWHGATCNLMIPRELWRELGPFAEDMDGGEDTLLTVRAREQGRFRFAPEALIVHENRTTWAAVLRHQFAFGRFNARLARRTSVVGGPALRAPALAPIALVGRLVSIYASALRCDRRLGIRAITLLPGVFALLVAWTAGLLREQCMRHDGAPGASTAQETAPDSRATATST